MWTVIKNLVTYSNTPRIKNIIVHCLSSGQKQEADIHEIPSGVAQFNFGFSPKDNFYFTCKRLAKLLPGPDAIIVAHDWLELGMASQLGLPNPLLYYVHGDYTYYYQLAVKHRKVIDEMVTVAESIKNSMCAQVAVAGIPVNYIRFPVPESKYGKKKIKGTVAFAGRISDGKGYPVLVRIAREAARQGLKLNWHILGTGDDAYLQQHPWPLEVPVSFYNQVSNTRVQEIFSEMECVMLPSTHEGMPIVIIEAMKAGAVPLVSDIPGGIQELVLHGQTGFKFDGNDVQGFVSHLALLQDEANRLPLSLKAKALADKLFNPVENTRLFEERLSGLSNLALHKKPSEKIYGSRLDLPWIPNTFVRLMRKNIHHV